MSLVKVHVYRQETDDVNAETGKPIIKTTYHTKPDGKGDVVKSVITDGSGTYFNRNEMTDSEVVAMTQGNCARLGNADLKKLKKRANRLLDRILSMRKQADKLGSDLLTDVQSDAIMSVFVALKDKAATSLYAPLSSSKKRVEEEPDIF